MADTIKHRHQSALPDGGADVDVNEWNDSLIVGGGSDGQVLTRNTGAADGWSWGAAAGGGLIGRQVFKVAGSFTYTPTVGTNSIVMELQGAGGGGGGTAQPGGTNGAFGRSGGAGAWLRKRLTAAFSGATIVVGAKGAGGAAGSNAGAAGGDTTFQETGVGGTLDTAAGGLGGGAISSNAPAIMFTGSAGGAATNGDVNVNGNQGDIAFLLNSSYCIGGRGANSRYGVGGSPGATNGTSNHSAVGSNATGNGAGGGGAAAVGTADATDRVGGNGSDGLIIIWEFA